jgi:CHAD domain-containing protein
VDAAAPGRHVAEEVAQRAWGRLAKAVRALGDDPPDPDLHEVRKRAKRARYAMELLGPALSGPTNALAKRLAKLQDGLGALQDAVVADQWLRRHVGSLSPSEAFTAGQLSGEEAHARRRARSSWSKLWRRVRARRPG